LVDRLNMVFNGTAVTQGVGRAVVTAKGMDTEVGRIAVLVQTTPQDPTPLQVEIGRVGRRLSIAVTYTGDHLMTAARIASDLDVSPPGTPAVSGIDLEGFNALNARSETVSAFRGLFANRWGCRVPSGLGAAAGGGGPRRVAEPGVHHGPARCSAVARRHDARQCRAGAAELRKALLRLMPSWNRIWIRGSSVA
jgi:hypothetical protein